MHKKAQLDQPFLYIFAILVIAFILLFGLRYIGKLQEFNEKALYLNFKSSLQDAVSQTYKKNPGSILTYAAASKNKPLLLPSSIESICVQANGESAIITPQPKSKEYEAFKINNLSPKTDNLCIKSPGKFSFTLENTIREKQTIILIDKT